MADSDEDYVNSSVDEAVPTPSAAAAPAATKARARPSKAQEASTSRACLKPGSARGCSKTRHPLQRGIIRHVMLILDLSIAMAEKDFRPTRYLLAIRYACDYVREYFEQNPISQLAVLGMRDGLAVRVSDMSGNPTDHIEAIQKLRLDDPRAPRVCRTNAPTHGTREVVIVFGALHSSDPGDIHQTIAHLVADKIRVSVVGLSAQVAVCRDRLVSKTNAGSTSTYGVALDDKHFRELLIDTTIPP
ncbi:uncharacterized protein H6S33_009829, partial [Morchella sextelata]|uniref:uncharacterized protein n=1 Tax=Morchella sextelata TaxID=1174677 RepID=UPI001D03F394